MYRISRYDNHSHGENKMSKKNPLIPDNAITKISKSAYNDVAHPILNEIGKTGADLLKFVALPFRFLGMTAEELEKKYGAFLQRTISKVPTEELILPQSVVASPLLDHVKYVFDEEGLSEMFSNLLANAMSANVEKMVHPAFVEMLKQMSPLDVEFMHLYLRRGNVIEISDINWKRGAFQRSLTIDSLIRLGIITSITYDNEEDGALRLTDFGAVFRDLCMSEPSDIVPEELFDDYNTPIDESIEESELDFSYSDCIGLAKKSEKNGKVYISRKITSYGKDKKQTPIIALRINNNSQRTHMIDSVYIESGNEHIVTETELPAVIPAGKYKDFIFTITQKNQLLTKMLSDTTLYVVQTGNTVYDMAVTPETIKEIKNYIQV